MLRRLRLQAVTAKYVALRRGECHCKRAHHLLLFAQEERPELKVVPSVPSQDRGQLDAALRDLRSGIPRRDQSVAERPLSRILLSS